MNFPFGFLGLVGIAAVIYVARAVRVVRQYEKGIWCRPSGNTAGR